MIRRALSGLITLSLITGCGAVGAPSQKELEDLLSQAQVDVAAKQYAEAEKKLLKVFHNSDKNANPYTRLASANQLADLELKQHNIAKGKLYLREAGAMGEAVSRLGSENPGSHDVRLLKEAKTAMMRWADSYADVGSFDSAKTLYTEAKAIEQQVGEPVEPENSADSRLRKLASIAAGEKQAIEQEEGLFAKSDPRYVAREERTADRKKMMNDLKLLNLEMARKPSKEIADKTLAYLPKIRGIYGIREVEYRAALNTAIFNSFMHGQRDKALVLLKEDMAAFEDIDLAKIEDADPTMLENANFLLTDLAQYAGLMALIDMHKEADELANRGLKLAKQTHLGDSPEYAKCLQIAAENKERMKQQELAIDLRKREIAMLKNVRLTDNYVPYFEAQLELGRDFAATGKTEEALQYINYSIERFSTNKPNSTILAYALLSKAEILSTLGDDAGALKCLQNAQTILEKNGSPEQKRDCYRALSRTHRAMHSLQEAQKMGLKALECCRLFPPEKQLTEYADCYRDLAVTEEQMGKQKQAIAHLRSAIDYQRKARGENDLSFAGMLNHLAILETQKGNFTEAEKLRLRALASCRITKEPGRSPLVSTLLQLASFYHKTNRQEKAVQYYRETIAAGEGIKEVDGVHYVRMARVQLGNILAQKDRQESIKMKNEALDSAVSNGNPIQDCDFHASLGDLCLNLQDFENGDKQYDEAEKIALGNKPPLKDLEIQVLNRKRKLYTVTKRDKLAETVADRLKRLQKLPEGH